MRRLLKYIMLIILLTAGQRAMSQYVIDKVCVGSERNYRVDGELGSTYTWTLTSQLGVVTTLPETGDTVSIAWNVAPGIYELATTQVSINGCDTLTLGTIEVYDAPIANAGEAVTICNLTEYTITTATASNYSTIEWTTSGDGAFDDNNAISPTYTFGANDILNGSVTLTLTANGIGDETSCPPSSSTFIITLDNLLVDAASTPASCPEVPDGTVQITPTNGTAPFSFTLDGTTNTTGTFTSLSEGTYTYTVTDAAGCEFSGEIVVPVLDPVIANVTTTGVTCFGLTNGLLEISGITGGSGSYEFRVNGGDWQSETAFLNLIPGDYIVEVRDANATGCIYNLGTHTVTEPQEITLTISGIDPTVSAATDGTATVEVIGGTPDYTYMWDDPSGQTTRAATGLAAGTYTVTVTDANGCQLNATITLVDPNSPLAVSIDITGLISCFGSTDGQLTASVTGGVSPYTYSWNPTSQTTAQATNLAAGNYTVTVTDNIGNTATASIELAQPAEILLTTNFTNPTAGGNNDGAASVVATGGTGTLTYSWSNGQSTENATNLVAGTYTVTVTDENGCETAATVTLTDPGETLAVSIDITGLISCFGSTDGQLTATVTGGVAPYSYSWNPTSQTTAQATNLAAGNYTVTVTDNIGNTATASIELAQPAEILLTTNFTNPTAAGNNDGSASVVASGGTGTLTYSWSNGQTTTDATNLVAGTYTVTVIDENGCEATATVTLSNPGEALAVSIDITGLISCFGSTDGQLTATATGGVSPYTYSWSSTTQTTAQASNLAAGNYTVTVTDNSGNSATASIELAQPAEIILTTNFTNPTAAGNNDGSASVVAIGGTGTLTYSWSNGQTAADATNLVAGTYTITVTDENGCEATATVTLSEPGEALAVSIDITGLISCFGSTDGQLTASVTGGVAPYTYSWNPTSQTTAQATNLAAGNYTVTVTDNSGNTATASIELAQPAEIILTTNFTNPTAASNNDGSASVVATGGTGTLTYSWNNGQTVADATNLVAGTYTVTVTDENGCEVTATVTLVDPGEALAVSIDIAGLISCFGSTDGQLTATATGGIAPYSYSWNPTSQTTAQATNLAAGNYTVTVTDNSGSTATASIELAQPAEIILTTNFTNPTAAGNNDGSASVVATGGTGTLTYSWNNGQTAADATNLVAGTYTITVTDQNGCEATATVTLVDPGEALAVSIDITGLISCFGSTDGQLTANVTGGVAPYTYSWNPSSQTTAQATNLAAGVYTVTVTDNSGNTAIASIELAQPAEIILTTNFTNPTAAGNNDGSASVIVTGGTGNLTYSWSNGQSTENATNLVAGTYTVTVTDENGCQATATVTLVDPGEALAVSIDITGLISCFSSTDGQLTASATGGIAPYSYSWSLTTQTTAQVSNLAAGNYTVTVTDNSGNTATASIELAQPAEILLTTNFTNPTAAGNNDGSASVVASGGTGTLTYSWSNGQSSADATNLVAGTYTVTVTDENGCEATATVTLVDPGEALAVSINITGLISCFGSTDGQLTPSVTGGVAPYTYSWNPISQTTAQATNLAAGNYTVTVTDNNGNTATASIELAQPAEIILTTNFTNPSAAGNNDGSASVIASGGTGTLTYSWSNGQTAADATNLVAGTYTVTVTDENGCEATATVTLVDPGDALAVNVVITGQISCFGSNDGQLTASISGGVPPYDIQWNDPASQTSLVAGNLSKGTYTVTVVDGLGVIFTATIELLEPPALELSFTSINPTTAGGNDALATVYVNGGTAPYTYQWSNGQRSEEATGLSAGQYTVTVTDANGCTIDGDITITDPTGELAVAIAVDNLISCFGFDDGQLSAIPTSGIMPYTYAWNPGGITDSTATGLSAGIYTVTVTDALGNTASASFTLDEPSAIVSSISFTNPTTPGGNDGSATVVASGGTAPYSYRWSNGQTSADASNLRAGTYTVTITDANGCVATDNITLEDPSPALSVSITLNSLISCYGFNDGQLTAEATGGAGGYSYRWNPTGQTSATAINLQAGSYQVTVTDSDGNTATATYNLPQPSQLATTISGNNPTTPGGNNGTASATVSGGTPPYRYAWSNGQTTQTATNLRAGVYIVTITDANDCEITDNITLVDPSVNLAVSIRLDSQISCFGFNDGQLTAVATGGAGGYTYRWNPTGQTTATATNLQAGSYQVTVTDSDGNTATANYNLPQPAQLATIISGNNPTTPGGNNGTASVAISGGTPPYRYSWSNGQTTQTATNLRAGVYIVTITDANDCEITDNITLVDPSVNLAVSIRLDSQISCFGFNDGQLTAVATGGAGGYTYRWNPTGQTTATASNLQAGSYQVTVTDSEGNTATANYNLTQPSQLATIISGNNPTTPGGNNGTASVAVSGGTPPYRYSWSNGQTTQTATNLRAGVYIVTITDANDCEISDNITLVDPSLDLAVSIRLNSAISCFGFNDGQLTAVATGGAGGYIYRWNPTGQTTATASNLQAGSYQVTVTDSEGKTATATYNLTQPTQLATIISGNNPTTPGGNTGTASVAVSGGTPPYRYSWSNGQTTQTVTNLRGGVYIVTITDANNCEITDNITLVDPSLDLAVSIRLDSQISCFGFNDGQLTAVATGGAGGYIYRWNPTGQTTATASNLQAGSYQVTVTDSEGKTASANYNLTQPTQLATIISGNNPTTFGGNNGSASVAVSGGTPPYRYSWSNGQTTQTATNLRGGVYIVTITDANNCEITDNITLVEPGASLSVQAFVISNVSCFNGNDGQVFAVAAGGEPPYTYKWNDPAAQANDTASNLAIGSYTVTATDSEGTTATSTVQVIQPNAIVVDLAKTNAVCGGINGTITVNVTGGVPPYQYSIANITGWQQANVFTNLAGGTYTIQVIDDNNCEMSATVTLEALDGPTILQVNTTPAHDNMASGSAEIISDKTDKVRYSIDSLNWFDSNVFENLLPGNYIAYVIDSNSCIDQYAFIINNLVIGEIELMAGRVTECIKTEVGVPVMVKNFKDIVAFNIQLTYNPDILEFKGYRNIHENLERSKLSYTIVSRGKINFTYSSNRLVTIKDGENLFNLEFMGVVAGETKLEWNFLECEIRTVHDFEVPVIYVTGLYNVIAAPDLRVSDDMAFCQGDSLTLRATSADGQRLSYVWTDPYGNKTQDSLFIRKTLNTLDAGKYSVVATNKEFCKSEKSVNIIVYPSPSPMIASSDTVCFNSPMLLEAGGNYFQYEWQDGSTSSTYLAYDPGTYSVKVTSDMGCFATTSVYLINCVIEMQIPNAFTPNNDGLNDVFRPILSGSEPSKYLLQIYTKWGQLIYSTKVIGGGWDGTVDGVLQPVDTYVYMISYEVPSYVTPLGISSPVTGRVSLIR